MSEIDASAALDIRAHGIAHRAEDGTVLLVRPAPSGAGVEEVEVDRALADRFALSTGDIAEGEVEPIPDAGDALPATALDGNEDDDYDERDEPAAVRGEKVPEWLVTRRPPVGKLVAIRRVNGLAAEDAIKRPSARLKRSSYERAAPDRWVELAASPNDITGRMLDFAAPFALGYAGLVHGPHGAGLTRTLHAVARGVTLHAPDALLFVLLAKGAGSRSEEITEWRRRFPAAEVIVCPAGHHRSTVEDALRVADLTLAAAQRQTELGRHVVLLVDSLTGLWASMLENEEADAQREADRSWSRQRIREWMQAAGNFAGEGLLGSGLGGSLTIVGSAWNRSVDAEAEEEGEIHPHLRLVEHVLSECGWRVAVSGALAAERLFPAIRVSQCLSRDEERFVPADLMERLIAARARLADLGERARYDTLMDALSSSTGWDDLLTTLGTPGHHKRDGTAVDGR